MKGRGSGSKMRDVRAANDFAIWRAGQSVKWDCTAKDIAAEVGLHANTVRATCNRRGWEIVRDGDPFAKLDTVSIMKSGREY